MKLVDASTLVAMANDGERYRYWYHRAHESITRYAEQYDLDVGVLASALAIASPRVTVRQSVSLALQLVLFPEERPPAVLPAVWAAWNHYTATGEIRGPKTSAFRDALLLDEAACVVDRWMVRACTMGHATDRITLGQYRVVERALRDTSAVMDWPAAQVQAAIWGRCIEVVGNAPGWLELPRN